MTLLPPSPSLSPSPMTMPQLHSGWHEGQPIRTSPAGPQRARPTVVSIALEANGPARGTCQRHNIPQSILGHVPEVCEQVQLCPDLRFHPTEDMEYSRSSFLDAPSRPPVERDLVHVHLRSTRNLPNQPMRIELVEIVVLRPSHHPQPRRHIDALQHPFFQISKSS